MIFRKIGGRNVCGREQKRPSVTPPRQWRPPSEGSQRFGSQADALGTAATLSLITSGVRAMLTSDTPRDVFLEVIGTRTQTTSMTGRTLSQRSNRLLVSAVSSIRSTSLNRDENQGEPQGAPNSTHGGPMSTATAGRISGLSNGVGNGKHRPRDDDEEEGSSTAEKTLFARMQQDIQRRDVAAQRRMNTANVGITGLVPALYAWHLASMIFPRVLGPIAYVQYLVACLQGDTNLKTWGVVQIVAIISGMGLLYRYSGQVKAGVTGFWAAALQLGSIGVWLVALPIGIAHSVLSLASMALAHSSHRAFPNGVAHSWAGASFLTGAINRLGDRSQERLTDAAKDVEQEVRQLPSFDERPSRYVVAMSAWSHNPVSVLVGLVCFCFVALGGYKYSTAHHWFESSKSEPPAAVKTETPAATPSAAAPTPQQGQPNAAPVTPTKS